MPFVSTAGKMCSKTQKNAKFWVWSILISNIEKFYSKLAYFHWNFRDIGPERKLCVIYAQTTYYFVEFPLS